MADPICRWRNTSIKQVSEFTQVLPHRPMPKDEARDYVERLWQEWDGGSNFFRTAYQLAAQLGLYYEDDTTFYPRFDHVLTLNEARQYIIGWIKRYYVPNPYTGSIRFDGCPVVLNTQLFNAAKLGESDLDAFFRTRLEIELGNKDILSNVLNNFSDVEVEEGSFFAKSDGHPLEFTTIQNNSQDKKAFFESFNDIVVHDSPIIHKMLSKLSHRQIIYYGAPGTGKSHGIKKQLAGVPAENIFRTTFHPDSDYSTFVGAYKPTMFNNDSDTIFSKSELIGRLMNMKNLGITYPCHKFAAKYWKSLQILSSIDIKDILSACDFTESMNVEIGKGIAIGQELHKDGKSSHVIYSFVAQTFLQAYIRAYQTAGNVYLIIEEINRGNCAQIFGDLFQLLDRDEEGKSDYKIKADADLRAFLEKELGCESDGIKGGELCLPSNLYIWATMNTSDQSLFPIDSAFKRRWDWKYMKIKDAKKGWKIGVEVKEGEKQDWWAFVEQINRVIANMTSSADKQLGYFFCKADKKADETEVEPTIISAETFVSKVVFYLWNDVFKDYGFEDDRLFKYKKMDEDGKETEEDLTFPAFYKDDDENSVDVDVVKQFIRNVMDWKAEETGKE